jgi:hypothetical protein
LQTFQKARKEHDKVLKNSIPQEYQPLVRKLAQTKVKSALADYGSAVLHGDQQGNDQSHAKMQIEETSLWLQERSRALKELGEMQIEHQSSLRSGQYDELPASHSTLLTYIGTEDAFKDIDPHIHQKMKTYIQNMKTNKEDLEITEKLSKKLINISSWPLKSRYLADAKKLIDEMETEHEKFKKCLRDRGWLERDASINMPVSHPTQPQADIASTSGKGAL